VHSGVALNDAVLDWLCREPLGELVRSLPPPVAGSSAAAEVLSRSSPSTALHFVLNHGAAPVACEVRRPVRDRFDGRAVPLSFELPGYAYRILREQL
jgi:hypothetical protein